MIKQIQKKDLEIGEAFDEEGIKDLSDSLTEKEAGRRLFEVAAACRRTGIDPESALRDYTRKVTELIEEHNRSGS